MSSSEVSSANAFVTRAVAHEAQAAAARICYEAFRKAPIGTTGEACVALIAALEAVESDRARWLEMVRAELAELRQVGG